MLKKGCCRVGCLRWERTLVSGSETGGCNRTLLTVQLRGLWRAVSGLGGSGQVRAHPVLEVFSPSWVSFRRLIAAARSCHQALFLVVPR